MELKTKATTLTPGTVLVKIPRSAGNAGDITGGLPVSPSSSRPATVKPRHRIGNRRRGQSFGKLKRGNREISVTSKLGETKKYLVPLSKQILVQENDYVRAGTPLSDGATTPADILNIMGPTAVQEYIVTRCRMYTACGV